MKRRMQEVEKLWEDNPNSGRIRVVERLGPTVKELVTNPSPWRGEHCGRETCPPCATKPGACRAKGVTYSILCGTCKEAGKEAVYHGESNRTLLDRSLEHLANLRRREENSVLLRHWKEEHSEEEVPVFQFHLQGRHRTSTERQLKEALNIQYSKADILMNAKTEFGRNCLVMQTTEFDEKKGVQTGQEDAEPHPRKRRREDSCKEEESGAASCRVKPPKGKELSKQRSTEKGILSWIIQRNGEKKDAQRNGL